MPNQLTYYERQKLEYWLKTSLSLREISKLVRRSHTILSREIRRNGDNRKKYYADTAQRLFEKRKHAKHIGKLDKYPKLKQYVHEKLKVEWSPEEIAGRLKNESKKRLSVTKVFTTTFTSETDGMKTGISCYRMVGQNDKRNGEEKGLKY